jgi:hypothetical protein
MLAETPATVYRLEPRSSLIDSDRIRVNHGYFLESVKSPFFSAWFPAPNKESSAMIPVIT